MKTISIRQPWAWLIVNRHKPVENRTWSTRHRGPTLIHAGQTFDAEGYRWIQNTFPDIQMPAPDQFERGGIVGRANLVELISPGDDYSSRWYMGDYGFLFEDAEPLPFIPAKGKLSFFETAL